MEKIVDFELAEDTKAFFRHNEDAVCKNSEVEKTLLNTDDSTLIKVVKTTTPMTIEEIKEVTPEMVEEL